MITSNCEGMTYACEMMRAEDRIGPDIRQCCCGSLLTLRACGPNVLGLSYMR